MTMHSRRDSGFALHQLDSPIILDHKSIYASINDFQLEPQMRPITEEKEEKEAEEQILDIDPEHNYTNSLGDKLETELAREDSEPIIRQKIIRTTIHPLRPTMTPIPEVPEEEQLCVCPQHTHDATNSAGDKTAAPAAGKLDKTDSVARDTTVTHAAPVVAAGKFDTTNLNTPHSPLGIFVDPKSHTTSPLLEFKSLKELKTSTTNPGTDGGNGGGNGGVVSGPFEPPGGGDWRGHSPPIPPSLLGLPKNKMGEWWRRRKAWFKKQRGDLKKFCRKLKRRK